MDASAKVVLGVNFASAKAGQSVNFVIPAWRVMQAIKKHLRDQPTRPVRGWLRVETKTPSLDLTAERANDALVLQTNCSKGTYIAQIRPRSLLMNALPPVSSGCMLAQVEGSELDAFGMGLKQDFIADRVDFENLFFMTTNLDQPASFDMCCGSNVTSHRVSRSWAANNGQGLRWVHEPFLEGWSTRFETFGDVTITELTLNHVNELFAAGNTHIGRFADEDLVSEPRLIIVDVRRGTYASEVLQIGSVVTKVNGVATSTLADFRSNFLPRVNRKVWTLEAGFAGASLSVLFGDAVKSAVAADAAGEALTPTVREFAMLLGFLPTTSSTTTSSTSTTTTTSANATADAVAGSAAVATTTLFAAPNLSWPTWPSLNFSGPGAGSNASSSEASSAETSTTAPADAAGPGWLSWMFPAGDNSTESSTTVDTETKTTTAAVSNSSGGTAESQRKAPGAYDAWTASLTESTTASPASSTESSALQNATTAGPGLFDDWLGTTTAAPTPIKVEQNTTAEVTTTGPGLFDAWLGSTTAAPTVQNATAEVTTTGPGLVDAWLGSTSAAPTPINAKQNTTEEVATTGPFDAWLVESTTPGVSGAGPLDSSQAPTEAVQTNKLSASAPRFASSHALANWGSMEVNSHLTADEKALQAKIFPKLFGRAMLTEISSVRAPRSAGVVKTVAAGPIMVESFAPHGSGGLFTSSSEVGIRWRISHAALASN